MTLPTTVSSECVYMFSHLDTEATTPLYPIECFGFECGNGWIPLIIELMQKIANIDTNKGVRVAQIKEKFGTLRFYVDGATDEIYDLIDEYEQRSAKICEMCGDTTTAKLRGKSWVQTLCNKCWRKKKG